MSYPDSVVIEKSTMLCITLFTRLAGAIDENQFFSLFNQVEQVFCEFVNAILLGYCAVKSKNPLTLEDRIVYYELFKSVTTFMSIILKEKTKYSLSKAPSSEMPSFLQALYNACIVCWNKKY